MVSKYTKRVENALAKAEMIKREKEGATEFVLTSADFQVPDPEVWGENQALTGGQALDPLVRLERTFNILKEQIGELEIILFRLKGGH